MNIQLIISKKITKALETINLHKNTTIKIQKSKKKQFGDYQINGIIRESNNIKTTPYELAKKINSIINLKKITNKVEISKQGYINIFLNKKWIAKKIQEIIKKEKFITNKINKKTIVVDYSSPNIAKQMHVGHLRSTIIGDSIARILKYIGHKVIKINHIGNWGTHFGMMIAYLENKKQKITKKTSISQLEHIYKKSRKKYENNIEFANISRKCIAKLQSGNKNYIKIWKKLTNISINHNQQIYKLLNVKLKKTNIIGESFYKNMLPKIVSDLINKGLATKNNGAIVINLKKYETNQNKQNNIIIQKKDGAYLYATTDIACAKYRYEILHANKILYYVDSRQKQYFKQIFFIIKKAGYVSKNTSMQHHTFGMILGKDKKPLKSRSGKSIYLLDLLKKSIKKSSQILKKRNPKLSNKEIKSISKIIGIGSIKYSDLSKNRQNDYIFSWKKMINLEGNTALYILYAYVRILSILKKQKLKKNYKNNEITLNTNKEQKLAICILQFEENILNAAKQGMPHIICKYIYDLTYLFSKFYENCNIINETNKKIKKSRLNLIFLTKKTLKTCLNLLGIKTINKM